MPKKTQEAVDGHDHGENDPFARGTFEWRDEGVREIGFGAPEPNDFNLDDYAGLGFTFRGKPILDQDGIIDQIATGRTIDAPSGIITYTFADTPQLVGLFNNPNYGFGASDGYRPFTPEQEEAARLAIQMWDDLIPQTFRETEGMGADIVFSNSADPAQAYAYYPINSRGWQFQSDVFIADPDLNWTNAWFTDGGYGNTTIIHELGHSLGLSHPGAYNFTPGVPLNYANNAEYAQDSEQYSIMSYWDAGQTGARIVSWDSFFFHNPQTPLLHDILAIQAQYGADPTTRAGDTTYGFNTTDDVTVWVYDFAENPYPYMALYDAGGVDTIDMSGWNSLGNFLNLQPGSFSSIGAGFASADFVNATRAEIDAISGLGIAPLSQAQINSIMSSYMVANANNIATDTGYTGVYASNYDNFAIAYNTIIENAIGSEGRDVIFGNHVDNHIEGRGGNDVLDGFEGNDTLDGGAGNDLIIGNIGDDMLTGGSGSDTFQFSDLELGDVITDFDGSEGDMIDLSAFAGELGSDLTFVEGGAFTGAAGEVIYDGSMVSVDVDGDSMADFSVTIANGADIDASMLALAAGA